MTSLINSLGPFDYLGKCLALAISEKEIAFTLQCGWNVVGKDTQAGITLMLISVLRRLEIATLASELQEAKQAATGLRAAFAGNWYLVAQTGKKRLSELLEAERQKEEKAKANVS